MSARRRLGLTITGWAFVLLGVAGLFLPFLQGILFLLIGLYVLSLVSPRARLVRQRLRQRFPRLADGLERAENWIKQRRGKMARERS